MRNSKRLDQKGLTLTEILVVMALLAVASVLVFRLFVDGSDMMERGDKRSGTHRQLVQLSRDWRAHSGGSQSLVTIFYPGGSADGGDLALSLPDIRTEDGQIQVDRDSSHPMVQAFSLYYRSGDTLKYFRQSIPPEVSPQPLTVAAVSGLVASDGGRVVLLRCNRFEIRNGTGVATSSWGASSEIYIEASTPDGTPLSLGTHLRLLP